MERLLGLENEYAFHATGSGGEPVDREEALMYLNAIARRELVSLPSLNGSGIFLANGGRLYEDTGAHQEWCTPESANPWDVVRYLAAGEQILIGLAGKLVQRRKLGGATFYKSNVDYSGAGTTWGAHENYMHRADPNQLPADLIPFLVSRVIVTGAGGFDPTTPTGCCFTLSPRAFHITASVTDHSTRGRGIYHTKDEPLCNGGHHRLHILVGDSLCSQTGNWLKFATTALVVALAEAGLHPGRDVALAQPVDALRQYASDPACRATAATGGGGRISALDIQRHYLDLARRHVTAEFMPAWGQRAVDEWAAMLNRLADGPPDSVATRLDWAIKHRLYGCRIAGHGFTWRTLGEWSNLLRLLHTCAKLLPGTVPEAGVTSAYLRRAPGPLKAVVRELAPHLAARGLHWDQLDSFMNLRLELFEIDTRFGELGPAGIFNALDSAGVLEHRFAGVDNIEHAMANPPAVGRARLRGQAIQRLHGGGSRCGCDWEIVVDAGRKLAMDLRDPWITEEHWSAAATAQLARADIRALLHGAPSPAGVPF